MTAGTHDSLFAITEVPFSGFGSWMSIAIPRGEEKIHFRNCHQQPRNLFPIECLVDGRVVQPDIIAKPWLLEFRCGNAWARICFESETTVRLRGQGMSLILGDKNLIYSESPNRAVINHRPGLRRYQLEVLQGNIQLEQRVLTQPLYPVRAIVSPGEEGGWELAIDEFWSTWVRPARATFDECLAQAESRFTTFLDHMPAAREVDGRARQLAAYIIWSCTVGPCGLIKRPTVLMSKNWMCNVWSWDQCFNAMALAAGEPELAMDQMLTLVDHQDEFGSYPDSINDVVIHYNFSKPPVHGWALSEILKRTATRPSKDVMQTMYLSLGRQVDWWMTHRRKENDRLPYYLHGNDSGWDNSTMFGRGVPLIAPDLAALLVTQMDVLADLAENLGHRSDWRPRADALYEALMAELWRGDHFVARLASNGSDVESQSLIPWLPLILGKRLPQDVRQSLMRGIEGHLTEWGLATERTDSPNYREDGYWQGPIWGPSTYIAFTGLMRCGFDELADDIARRFCALCRKSGFAENFNALTGDSLCDPAYTWTSSVFLLLAHHVYTPQ